MKIRLFMILFCGASFSFAQLPNSGNDWQLVFHETFDSLNTSIWCTNYCWGGNSNVTRRTNNGKEYNLDSNIVFNNGTVTIKVDTLLTPISDTIYKWDTTTVPYWTKYIDTIISYNYQGGVLYSKDTFQYKYGYFEMKAKVPIDLGLWPAFWLYSACNGGVSYDEIDIMEKTGATNALQNKYETYVHYYLPGTCDRGPHLGGFSNGQGQQLEHRYGVFWRPNRTEYYFDRQLVKTIIDTNFTPTHEMHLIINLAFIKQQLDDGFKPILPATYKVNYLSYYKYPAADCANDTTLCTYNNATYHRAVKKSITSGGTSCNVQINTSDSLTMRATDYILLDENTTINPDGIGSFSTIIQDCP